MHSLQDLYLPSAVVPGMGTIVAGRIGFGDPAAEIGGTVPLAGRMG